MSIFKIKVFFVLLLILLSFLLLYFLWFGNLGKAEYDALSNANFSFEKKDYFDSLITLFRSEYSLYETPSARVFVSNGKRFVLADDLSVRFFETGFDGLEIPSFAVSLNSFSIQKEIEDEARRFFFFLGLDKSLLFYGAEKCGDFIYLNVRQIKKGHLFSELKGTAVFYRGRVINFSGKLILNENKFIFFDGNESDFKDTYSRAKYFIYEKSAEKYGFFLKYENYKMSF